MEQPSFSNDINYVPSFVDIEGLQGINSTQGMNLAENNGLYPIYGDSMQMQSGHYPMGMEPGTNPVMGIDPMTNMGCMNPMMGMDPNQMMMPGNMYNTPPMSYPEGLAGIMSCIANMCYMTSLILMQMANGGNYMTPMGTHCGGNTMEGYTGYPPYNY
ncbi:MAG: hypothetical protein ACOWWR_04170 [Eubacteriales bacterium]